MKKLLIMGILMLVQCYAKADTLLSITNASSQTITFMVMDCPSQFVFTNELCYDYSAQVTCTLGAGRSARLLTDGDCVLFGYGTEDISTYQTSYFYFDNEFGIEVDEELPYYELNIQEF